MHSNRLETSVLLSHLKLSFGAAVGLPPRYGFQHVLCVAALLAFKATTGNGTLAFVMLQHTHNYKGLVKILAPHNNSISVLFNHTFLMARRAHHSGKQITS